MTKLEQIREGMYLIINNYTRGKLTPTERRKLRDALLEFEDSQGVVVRVDGELPELTEFYIKALQGGIIEKHMKNGIENVEELKIKVYEELPQVICDVVNSGLAGYVAVEPLIKEEK